MTRLDAATGLSVHSDQVLSWFATEADASHSRVHVVTELHAASAGGILLTEFDNFVDGEGVAFESGRLAEITVRDGLIASATARDLDKLPEMLDEFDRRAIEHGGPSSICPRLPAHSAGAAARLTSRQAKASPAVLSMYSSMRVI